MSLLFGVFSCKSVIVSNSSATTVSDNMGSSTMPVSTTEPKKINASLENTLLTDELLAKLLVENKILVLDFTAKWCGPCQKMAPAVEKLKNEWSNKMRIEKVDFDLNRKMAQNFAVDEIPTILIFKDKKIVMRSIGGMNEEQLRKLILGSI